ncbi:MAG: SAM hydrolase/SAM-dependent halogenase family protein [Candidatus Bathyarchaeia archaeon]|jgi:S-adenosylmethionine hydrolase
MITLTTDFGLKDPYVAEMKGAIYTINPQAKIVDITHEVDKFNVRMGAFVLASAAPYFPEGTVHVAVVDPGVGTARRAIVVQTKSSCFVGPDNGVLMLAAKKQGIQHIYELANPKFRLPQVSSTFHGRDIFAPAAAHLEMGVQPAEFGPEISEAVTQSFGQVQHQNGCLVGKVLHIDGFGNVITNIHPDELPPISSLKVKLADNHLEAPVAKAYGETEPQQPIALVGSHGFLEVALNQGSAKERYGVKIGDRVEVATTS